MTEFDTDPNIDPLPVEVPVGPVRKKPRAIWFVAVIIGVVLLGSAAFLGVRLLSRQTGSKSNFETIPIGGKDGMAYSVSESSIEIQPADEIPARQADASGLVSQIKDRSLYVQTGENFVVSMSENGEVDSDVENKGPLIEAVVTGETQIYADTTFDSGIPEEMDNIQQLVEPADFNEIQADTMISVWGSKRGDRLIAEVILFTRPLKLSPAR